MIIEQEQHQQAASSRTGAIRHWNSPSLLLRPRVGAVRRRRMRASQRRGRAVVADKLEALEHPSDEQHSPRRRGARFCCATRCSACSARGTRSPARGRSPYHVLQEEAPSIVAIIVSATPSGLKAGIRSPLRRARSRAAASVEPALRSSTAASVEQGVDGCPAARGGTPRDQRVNVRERKAARHRFWSGDGDRNP